mmetsp:Transcript_941/g.2291  ORF Transcript_941/g.2291 Transcript_941/m.2291 type:complete len:387 (-) Transcript_941:270-1430(-)
MYGRSILMEEVSTLFAASLAKYLQENKIQVLGEPMPVPEKVAAIDWDHQRNFELDYIIGTAGPFSCTLSKAMHVTAYKINQVAEKTIHTLVAQLQQTYGKVKMVEKSAASDVIYGELRYPVRNFKTKTRITVGELSEKGHKVFIDLSPASEIMFEVRQVFIEAMKLPGVSEEMCKTMLQLGGSAEFTVQQIQRLSPAALKQDFFDKILGQGIVKSAQAFKKELQARLLQRKQAEADLYLEQKIQDLLLEEHPIALPDRFLKEWLQSKKDIVPEEQLEGYYQQYAKALRWSLFIEVLSTQHNLQVTQEEVVDEMQRRLQKSGGAAKQLAGKNREQPLRTFSQEDHGKSYQQLHREMHFRKCNRFIKDQITILTQDIDLEAFEQLSLT